METYMKKKMVTFLVVMTLIISNSQLAFSSDSQGVFFSPELGAKYGAEHINATGTLGKMLEDLSSSLSAQELAGIKSLFSEKKIGLNTKLPKCSSKANLILCGKEKVTINADRTFSFRGNVFRS